MKIISLLPIATEIVFQLGLGDMLVGISHVCNYPLKTERILQVSKTNFNDKNASSFEVDARVERKMHEHACLYTIIETLLKKLQLTHIITQQLCGVCVITSSDIQRIISRLPEKPEILSLNPIIHSEIYSDISMIGLQLRRENETK